MKDKEIIAFWDYIARAIETGEKSGAKVTVVKMTAEQAEATYNLIKRLKRENNSYRNKAQAQKGEIRRLNARNNELNALNKTASIETVKEFDERFKKKANMFAIAHANPTKPMGYEMDMEYRISKWNFDNLVKERI